MFPANNCCCSAGFQDSVVFPSSLLELQAAWGTENECVRAEKVLVHMHFPA